MHPPQIRVRRTQVWIALALVVGLSAFVFVGWAFSRQISLLRQMEAVEQQLLSRLATEQARQAELMVELEHVRSDEYVEQWARTRARLVRPGEVPVVVLTATPQRR